MRNRYETSLLALALVVAAGCGSAPESEPTPAPEPERDRTQARVRMARTLLEEGQVDQALEQLRRLARTPEQSFRPGRAPAWGDDMVAALIRRGAVDLADSLLDRIGPVSARSARQKILTASALVVRGEFDEAVSVYQSVRGDDPALQRRALQELASLHMKRGETEAAVERGREALALDPEHGPSRVLVAIALDQLGRPDEALEELTHLAPSPARWTAEAEIYLISKDRPDTAVTLVRRAIRQVPNDANLPVLLARALLADGQPEAALRSLQSLVASGIDGPEILELSADGFEAAGQPERAAILRERVADEARRSERDRLRAWGLQKSEEGELEDALDHFGQALAVGERGGAAEGELHHDRGVVLARLQRWDAALNALREAARLRPDDASVWINLARLYDRTERPAERDAALARARALDPESSPE